MPVTNINLEKTSTTQPESTIKLIRHHLLELILYLSQHPVLQDVEALVKIIDDDMPYMVSLVGLPGLLLLFRYERCRPSRALQLLRPQCLLDFRREIVSVARRLLEDSFDRWS